MATKKSSKKDPLKSKTEWTVTEFQMWLHGAYALQGEDWVPNAEQWNLIVDIIYKLKSSAPAAKRPAMPPVGGYGGPAGPVQDWSNVPQNPDLGMGTGGGSVMASALVGEPPEANMPLSKLRELREGKLSGPSNGNVLAGNGQPGEKTVKTGTFE